jgi:hypothetical protein
MITTNVYAPGIPDSVKRVAERQGAQIFYMPGHGPHAHRIIAEGAGDVFDIKTDVDLNRALNSIVGRAYRERAPYKAAHA